MKLDQNLKAILYVMLVAVSLIALALVNGSPSDFVKKTLVYKGF